MLGVTSSSGVAPANWKCQSPLQGSQGSESTQVVLSDKPGVVSSLQRNLQLNLHLEQVKCVTLDWSQPAGGNIQHAEKRQARRRRCLVLPSGVEASRN